MNNIKIVRLQNGEDIVCSVDEIDGYYLINEPMAFQLSHKNDKHQIAMYHYLPVQVMKENQMMLCEKDILFIGEPTASFAEYYVSSIIKLKELMDIRSSLEEGIQDESLLHKVILDAFNELEVSEDTTKH